jgi:predicted PurR-regulated permease PerM
VVVLLVTAAAAGVFVALAVPVVASQATALANHIPGYLQSLKNPHTTLGKLNSRYHVVSRLQGLFQGKGSSVVKTGAVTAGKTAVGVLYSALIVAVVTIYLLADMPRIRKGIYRMAPQSRRARMIVLTDEIMTRVGGYVLGNVLISIVTGLATTAWALIFGIPYPVLLGLLVALLDLIPLIGSTIGGVVVGLVALAAVSVPVAVATVVFYAVFRFVEDHILGPRVMGRTVDVPPLLTIVAVLIGAAILGIVGALVAIPIAAGARLLLKEIAGPRLDRS